MRSPKGVKHQLPPAFAKGYGGLAGPIQPSQPSGWFFCGGTERGADAKRGWHEVTAPKGKATKTAVFTAGKTGRISRKKGMEFTDSGV